MDNDQGEDVSMIAHRLARIEAWSWRPEDQKDLAQDVLEKYLKHVESDEAPDEPQAWMRVVTRTTAMDIIRAGKQPTLTFQFEDSDELLSDVLNLKAAGPSLAVVTQDFLDKVMDHIDPDQAQLIVWKYVDGRPADWIGEQTGRSEAAARKAVNRALHALRKVVENDQDLHQELRATMSRWYSI